jgi:hypothetical protein
MVLKQDGSGLPMLPTDFRIGLDVGILGRSIRIYDIDQYTREFFQVRTYFLFHQATVKITVIFLINIESWPSSG